jgi:multicomponent Na+:H+ antiporter subunit D
MISQGAAYGELSFVWFSLIAASAGVFLHAGIKFPWFVFFQKDSGMRPRDPAWNMQAAMIIFAGLCIVIGVFPEVLYRFLPYAVDYVPYTADHLVSQFQLLLFAGLAFFVTLPLMKRTLTISLDVDYLWRRVLPAIWQRIERLLRSFSSLVVDLANGPGRRLVHSWVNYHGPDGPLAKTWPTGSMLLWVTVILLVILIGATLRTGI